MKKIILCVVSGLLILSIGIIPQQIIRNATHYSVITPSRESYQPQLICSGYVTAKEGIRMVVNGNVVVKELTAENGSWVTAGQVIAITDAPDIADTFLSQSLEAPISNINPSDFSSLAAQYGMTIPTAHSEKLQTDINKLPTAEPTPKVAKAPISGIITWNDVSEGRFIPAGSPLCTILGLDNYKAIVQVPAEDAELIAIGAKAVISGSEIGNNSYVGTVTTVGNSISHGIVSGGYSSVIDVSIAVSASSDSMRHGAGVTCSIEIGSKEEILTLPYEAIHQDEKNNEYVYCSVNNVLKKKYINTGIELDDTIEITDGITATDVIATVSSEKLQKRYILEPMENK